MSKSLITISLLLILTTACNRSYVTPTPVAGEIQFAQPLATTTPTALFNSLSTATPAIVTATADVACSAAPLTRVKVGKQVTVTVEDWDKLKLRSNPQISSHNVVLELNQYSQLRILDGPICVSSVETKSSFLFWKVAVIPSGEIGWVAEGDLTHYFIE